MKKINKKFIWFISILSFLCNSIFYFYLPDKIPVHWNYKMEIDRWGDSKYIFLFGALPILLLLLLEILPKLDPRKDNYKKHEHTYVIFQVATVLLFILLNWITIAVSFHNQLSIDLILPGAMCVLFIIIGNYMPKLKSNYFVGIKTPWTLSNDIVWRKTHKLGGYIFVLYGFLMLIMGVLKNSIINSISIVVIIGGVIMMYVYSYVVYRNLNKQTTKNVKDE